MSVTATNLSADQRAGRTAARQHGALGHGQALDAGLTDQQISDRVRSGRWRRAVRGVYLIDGAPDTWMQRAWIAFLATRGAGGVVSHLTCGAALGVLRASPVPHVTVPPKASDGCRTAIIHRSRVLPEDRTWHGGLAITTPSRLVVDMAAIWGRPEVETLTDDVLCLGLASPTSVLAAADRAGKGRRGVGLVRAVLEVWTEGIEPGSPAEMRLLRRLADLGVTDLVSQFNVYDRDGEFVARLDLADPVAKRGLEYDGLRSHGPRAWARDEQRYARLAALGWDIEEVTKLDLVPGATRLREMVGRWTGSAAA